jgi:hypothetical protein
MVGCAVAYLVPLGRARANRTKWTGGFETRKILSLMPFEKRVVEPTLSSDGRFLVFFQIDQWEKSIMLVDNFRWFAPDVGTANEGTAPFFRFLGLRWMCAPDIIVTCCTKSGERRAESDLPDWIRCV